MKPPPEHETLPVSMRSSKSRMQQVAYARWMHFKAAMLRKYAGCREAADNNGPGVCSKSEERLWR